MDDPLWNLAYLAVGAALGWFGKILENRLRRNSTREDRLRDDSHHFLDQAGDAWNGYRLIAVGAETLSRLPSDQLNAPHDKASPERIHGEALMSDGQKIAGPARYSAEQIIDRIATADAQLGDLGRALLEAARSYDFASRSECDEQYANARKTFMKRLRRCTR